MASLQSTIGVNPGPSLELIQNVVAALSEANRPVQSELDKTLLVFKDFIEGLKKESVEKSKQIAALESEVIKLKSEKQQLHHIHEEERKANSTQFREMQEQISELSRKLINLDNELSTLNSRYNAHEHTVRMNPKVQGTIGSLQTYGPTT